MAGVYRISLWRISLSRIDLWLRREVLDRVLFHGRPLVCALAFVWRRLLFRTTFVAITGSLGKTTAKQCVAACLAARYRTACIPVDSNVNLLVGNQPRFKTAAGRVGRKLAVRVLEPLNGGLLPSSSEDNS